VMPMKDGQSNAMYFEYMLTASLLIPATGIWYITYHDTIYYIPWYDILHTSISCIAYIILHITVYTTYYTQWITSSIYWGLLTQNLLIEILTSLKLPILYFIWSLLLIHTLIPITLMYSNSNTCIHRYTD